MIFHLVLLKEALIGRLLLVQYTDVFF